MQKAPFPNKAILPISAGQTKQPATRRAKRSKNQFLSILTKRGGRGGGCQNFHFAKHFPPLPLHSVSKDNFPRSDGTNIKLFPSLFGGGEKNPPFFFACETAVIGKNRTSANKTPSDFRAEKKLHQPGFVIYFYPRRPRSFF